MHIASELLCIAKGEVLDDSWTRQVYSVDSSHYQMEPMVVVFPKDADDVQQICEYSHSRQVPITAKGAGTGLLGQSLSNGIILDFTKHMNKILDIQEDSVTVQPGIVKVVLDNELKKRNKFLPPDPASSNYCTVGGMIANNSSGIHSLGYGNTIDFLEGIRTVYADGNTGFASAKIYDGKILELRKLLLAHLREIKSSYPSVSKNSCGYRLDAVIAEEFNPHKVFAASEGTLGILTSAKLRVLDRPTHRYMMVLGFEDLTNALFAVPRILKFSPIALEMLDHTVIRYQRDKQSKAGCLLFVEFAGNRGGGDIEDRIVACRQELAGKCSVIEYASDEKSLTKIWEARKSALNSIMKLSIGSRKPLGLIEDTVVHPASLVSYATKLLHIYRENRLEYFIYGHVGNGNMHTRPLIDTASTKEIELMHNIADKVFEHVVRSKGSITGEHGDGLARTHYIQMMYGKQVTYLFSLVKKLFDPSFTMNPGKKVPLG
ncbi:MAG: FAD-binding oxidoreductase [Thermoproteota archaeon]|nr:FAD-binding oxidoreductase [Thermoproteota archaeon]